MSRPRSSSVSRGLTLAIAAATTLVVAAGTASAAAGSLDPAFDHDGKATTAFWAGSARGTSVAVQGDGKVVVAGSAAGRIALARYTTTGALDPTFGGDGRVTTELEPGSAGANGVAIQSNGRIVVAGCADAGGPSSGGLFALARFLPDGTLDGSFGGGIVTTRFGRSSCALAIAIQPNGRIVAAGGLAVARYLPSGALDPSFSGDGKANVNSRHPFSGARAVAVQPNGKVVVAGGYDFYGFALARFNPNGTSDKWFGRDGLVETTPGCGEGAANGVAVGAGGRIVVAGYTDVGHEYGDHCGPSKFALARYLPDGSLDPSFSGDGQVATGFPDGGAANAVAIDHDGRIVAAGAFGSGFAVARYRGDGTLDPTFGSGGRVRTVFGAGFALAAGVAVGPAGKIVAAGSLELRHGACFAVARYLAG